jgi:DNA-directed RNA polymerase specialized sigma24 family protein
MKVENPIKRFLKRIGAFTVSDHTLTMSEIYESLPSDEREILRLVTVKGRPIEEAGCQMGLGSDAVKALYTKAINHVHQMSADLPKEDPAP